METEKSMKIMVTGAGGFVGARILDMWRGQFALCAFPSDTLRTADENAVLRFILKEHPDVIVHTAALSNTRMCCFTARRFRTWQNVVKNRSCLMPSMCWEWSTLQKPVEKQERSS